MMGVPNPARNANTTVSPIYPVDPRGAECCKFEDELIRQFNLNQPPPPYDPQGPNSNTFAATIIRRAGGIAVFPGFALGADIVRNAHLDRRWSSAAQLFAVWIWVPARRQSVVQRARTAGSNVCRLPVGIRANRFLVQVVGGSHPGRTGIPLGHGRAEVGDPFDGYRGESAPPMSQYIFNPAKSEAIWSLVAAGAAGIGWWISALLRSRRRIGPADTPPLRQ